MKQQIVELWSATLSTQAISPSSTVRPEHGTVRSSRRESNENGMIVAGDRFAATLIDRSQRPKATTALAEMPA